MKNLRVRLPEETHRLLRVTAERTKAPATALAREAIEAWLRQEERRRAQHDAIAAYAETMAGTALDLDADLERAGIEHLTEMKSGTK
jgi:predicted transcriptional regulator